MVFGLLAAPVISGIITFIGILLKNEAIAIIGLIGFLYFIGIFATLPAWLWVVVIIIIFLWIIKLKK